MRAWCLLLIAAACGGSPPPPPEATPEPKSSCEPGRCLEDISSAVRAKKADSRVCYDEARKRQPGIKGRIVINFVIDAQGKVAEASQGMQDDQIVDADLVDCLTALIRSLQFTPSAAGKTTRAYHEFSLS